MPYVENLNEDILSVTGQNESLLGLRGVFVKAAGLWRAVWKLSIAPDVYKNPRL